MVRKMIECSFVVAVFVIASLVVMFIAATAEGAGLSTYYSDTEKNYSVSASKYMNDGVPEWSLSGNISTKVGDIEWASVQWSQWSTSANTITVYMNFSGCTGVSPAETFPGGQSMNGMLNGHPFNQSVYTGFYNTGDGGKGFAYDGTLGEDWAYGNSNLNFFSNDVININGSASFNDGDPWQPEYFNFNPSWTITFRSAEGAIDFGKALSAGGAQEIPSVPEPATMGLLAIGGMIGLVRRRRQQS